MNVVESLEFFHLANHHIFVSFLGPPDPHVVSTDLALKEHLGGLLWTEWSVQLGKERAIVHMIQDIKTCVGMYCKTQQLVVDHR